MGVGSAANVRRTWTCSRCCSPHAVKQAVTVTLVVGFLNPSRGKRGTVLRQMIQYVHWTGFCMWQSNLLQVAKFLDAGMKRLQTVDPDEGSNI